MTDRFTRGWEGQRHKGKRMGTLYADSWLLDGDVTLSISLDGLPPIARADLLSDWIGLLKNEYSIALKEMREAGFFIPEHQP